jgi:carotene biosynthesis associated membrane protein
MPEAGHALRRSAVGAFAAHAALIVFSTAAMLTVLNGPPSATLQSEPAATIMRVGWQYSGQTYVVLGALAGLLHAAFALGGRRAVALFLSAGAIALGSELLGTSTGFPFGEYAYTPLLGYRVLGLVPYPIPISWFYMLYASLALTARIAPVRDDARTRWVWATAAALMLTAWDVAMDPAMVQTGHWVWREPGAFYGMPFSNWIGWLLTGFVIARVMLWIAPPSAIAAGTRREWLPAALYAINGVMPVAICLRDGLWGAATLGTLAMAIPLGLAVRFGRRRGAASSEAVAAT